jgi:hypothetical protein
VTRRQCIEAALAAWRDAERRLAADEGDRHLVMQEVATYRAEFQRQCATEVVVPSDAIYASQVITI